MKTFNLSRETLEVALEAINDRTFDFRENARHAAIHGDTEKAVNWASREQACYRAAAEIEKELK